MTYRFVELSLSNMEKRIQILVVEDETFLRLDTVEILQDAGFDVVEAVSADEAILMLVRYPDIRLVFTDIDMPGSMNGLLLAAAVRNRWPPIKIIATSGHFKVQLDDLPADAKFFTKPYQPIEIVSAVRELTSHASA